MTQRRGILFFEQRREAHSLRGAAVSVDHKASRMPKQSPAAIAVLYAAIFAVNITAGDCFGALVFLTYKATAAPRNDGILFKWKLVEPKAQSHLSQPVCAAKRIILNEVCSILG